MPRDIPVGNGSFLVAFDTDYLIRDVYFPYVGLENHSNGHAFRFGIWVEGEFSPMGSEWQKDLQYVEDTLVTVIKTKNSRLQLELTCHDAVDFHVNVYVKEIVVKNLTNKPREARLFFSHDFHISGSEVGDTAFYDPRSQALIHYKGQRYFLMNCCDPTKCGVEYFACGLKETQGLEGTWKDAEDGVLSGNVVAHGSVDSTVGITITLPANGEAKAHYWMCVGTTYHEVVKLNRIVREKNPEELLKRTANYMNEGDAYHQVERKDIQNVPGNPWFICTLWWAEYLIARAKSAGDLEEALRLLEWVRDHALPSGVLAEQVNPHTGEPLSVSPLTWSHGAFVVATLEYLKRKVSLEMRQLPPTQKKGRLVKVKENKENAESRI